jgi:hypothetical protein
MIGILQMKTVPALLLLWDPSTGKISLRSQKQLEVQVGHYIAT